MSGTAFRTNLIRMVLMILVSAGSASAASQGGIPIKPDKEGRFEYVDDFATPRVFREAFVDRLPPEAWRAGSLINQGPHTRSVIWRFVGDRAITGIEIAVDQMANAPNLGGRNELQLSSNGLDWKTVADSNQIEPDHNASRRGVLPVGPDKTEPYLNRGELWLRLILQNYSGLPTNISNEVRRLSVKLTLGNVLSAEADAQAEARAAWGKMRADVGWRSIVLDWADPIGRRAPHYFEDADGWLQPPGANPHLITDNTAGFPVRRHVDYHAVSAPSMVMFVETDQTAGDLMARLTVRTGPDASRTMEVLWDGRALATFDVGEYFERDKVFYVSLPGPHEGGAHELRIAGADRGRILVRQVMVAGEGRPRWTAKPALPSGGALEVLSAYYMPDPRPPDASQVVEGRQPVEVGLVHEGLQSLYQRSDQFGALRVIVRNTSKVPVRLSDMLHLNGQPIKEHYVDFATSAWDAPGVVWYRMRPKLIEPGRCAQVYVRFRQRPAGEKATVRIDCENAKPIEVDVPYVDPQLSIDYVTTGPTFDKLYAYVRRADGADVGNVTTLTLDGNRLRHTAVYGPDFPGNVALLVVDLPVPLKRGAHHVVKISTDNGRSVAAQFRVMHFWYPRTSIHIPPDKCQQLNMNLAMWHAQSLETCLKHDIYSISAMDWGGDTFGQHERVRFVLGTDEPDAHDNRGGGYDVGLGYHARRMAQSAWQTLIEHCVPQAESWIIMNGTTRPLNWGVYGQLADITCFDPYPINYYGGDHAYVRESLEYARLCGAPRPMHGCLEAFGYSRGQGVPGKHRGPIPAEWRQNVVQAIGVGMKGLTSWVWVQNAGGFALSEPMQTEVAAANKLIEHIENDLLIATPIDLATSDAGPVNTGVVGNEQWPKDRVWVGALLSGPDTIVIAAVNHIPASKPDPPTITSAENVTVTVKLPEYLTNVSAFEATEDGVNPYAQCTIKDGQALLKLDAIESGRVFVLRRK